MAADWAADAAGLGRITMRRAAVRGVVRGAVGGSTRDAWRVRGAGSRGGIRLRRAAGAAVARGVARARMADTWGTGARDPGSGAATA